MDPKKEVPENRNEPISMLEIIIFIFCCTTTFLGAIGCAYLLENFNMDQELREELTVCYYFCLFVFCHVFFFHTVMIIFKAIRDIMFSLEVEDIYRKDLILQSGAAIFNGAVAIFMLGFVDIDAEIMYLCQHFFMHISFDIFCVICINLRWHKIEDISYVKSAILSILLGIATFKIVTMDTIYTKQEEINCFDKMFLATCVFTWFAGVVFYMAWTGEVVRRFGQCYSDENEKIDVEYGTEEDGIEEEDVEAVID
ncbi:hypothetical protein GCK72_011332 [Caenorhabditis remanei]|uniref:Transmembrane protein n=1 Tax=Caenorhabditis remanei TaxID=31234 RepID=A0A6A5H7A0_CAERE|nr:hypothetical protein GCK72_011332 [Caenorhabditis remanei]KAF1763067.1 hypothetical protein GCK72_011332 [Caenorhabditis remanei]